VDTQELFKLIEPLIVEEWVRKVFLGSYAATW
jgi:hypothetical protein